MNQVSEVVMKLSFSDEIDQLCRGVGLINGVMIALVQVQEFGCELWRIDFEGEHELFADINEGEASSNITYRFGEGTLFEGWYYFGAYDDVNKYRLWRTDGQDVERIREFPPIADGFYGQSISSYQTSFEGRNYIAANTSPSERKFFSTDGSILLEEPQPPLNNSDVVTGYHTLFDKLIVTIRRQDHEPWVFDGNEYRLLRDLVPDTFGEISLNLWFYFDESWVFNAQVPNTTTVENAFFYTDGERVIQLPHDGRRYINSYNALSGFVSTRDYRHAVGTASPEDALDGIPVMQIGKYASSEYQLTTPPDPVRGGSVAILDDEAYVLANNRLFRLGESSAEEEHFEVPGDWEGSEFRFIGSNAYFKNVYIRESGPQDDTRVWVWNKHSAELLKTEDGQPIMNAEVFQHIGNDIYFYGEDELNGWALRKIPDVVIKRLPALAKVTGAWFDPATSGQGFVLHPIDDERTFYSFYGFEDDGSPLWLTGVGSTRLEIGRPSSVDMIVTSGGRFSSFNPDHIANTYWGTLEITFETCSKANASLDGLSGQQTMNMISLTKIEGVDCFYTNNPPKPRTVGITGAWFDPATSGQGLSVISISDERALISFLGFNDDTERIWLFGVYDGQLDWNKPLQLMMMTASGGRFGGFSPEEITEVPWGNMTITFENCDKAIATLSGTDGQQTMNIVKLAKLQGSDLDCP